MANSTNGDLEFSPMPKKDCFFFVQYGKCSYDHNCKFNHPPKEDSQVVQKGRTDWKYVCKLHSENRVQCKFFRSGYCKYGTYCNFIHSIPNPPFQYNSDGLPMRLPLCSFYMSNHRCDYGASCKFHHPELYFHPQEYDSHASVQALEYDEGLPGSALGEHNAISAANSPHLLSNDAYNGNQ